MQPYTDIKQPACILCGRGLEVCPLFRITCREDMSPRGKAFLLANIGMQGISSREASNLAGLCTGCGRCADVCPQNMDLPGLIARLRFGHPQWKSWLFSRILTGGSFYLPLLAQGGRLFPESSVGRSLAVPRGNAGSLFRVQPPRQHSGRAVIFPGCLGRFVRRDLEKKAASLLTSAGLDVLPVPDWKCCGFPLGQAGYLQEQQSSMQSNLKTWEELGRPQVYVFCATCRAGLTSSHAAQGLPQEIQHLAANTFLLSRVLPDSRIEFLPQEPPQELVWHEPCHGTKDTAPALQNLLLKAGLNLKVASEQCCGLGGSFRLQAPDLSLKLARELWQNILPEGPGLCLTECAGCMIQLASTSPPGTTAVHWLELFQDEDTEHLT
ncbi:(Fe-S)-binding protein [Desulfonatronospira sp.]|uniref:(Fe-S)-binding protein n=1 Tax=Desulfonatronospira sp. TaxID=1962951 RepID=UPI0025B7EA45|nr:(Fe-S)-binding protein [Desulfonatronospira sp.]